MRRADLRYPFCDSLNFAKRPPAKPMPQRVVAAPEFFPLSAHDALGVQAVIATVVLMQCDLKRPVVVRASDHAVLPELLHDLMRLFR